MSRTDRQPKPGSLRTRRWRELLSKGERVFDAPLPEYPLIEALIKAKWLRPEDADDPMKVKAAWRTFNREWIKAICDV